jgi:hypothetical protein
VEIINANRIANLSINLLFKNGIAESGMIMLIILIIINSSLGSITRVLTWCALFFLWSIHGDIYLSLNDKNDWSFWKFWSLSALLYLFNIGYRELMSTFRITLYDARVLSSFLEIQFEIRDWRCPIPSTGQVKSLSQTIIYQ